MSLSARCTCARMRSNTHPLTMSISVKREHTHLPSTWHAHTTTQHCVCERESDSKGHFTNAACQGGGEQHSNSSITTIKHTSNQERESERCHRRRERRGEVERKKRRLTKKEQIQNRKGERKALGTCMWERGNYHRHVYSLLIRFKPCDIHFSAEHKKRIFFLVRKSIKKVAQMTCTSYLKSSPVNC